MRHRSDYRFWAGKLEGKRPFGRPRHRGNDNVTTNIQEPGLDDVD
jgi:hypothetical protein